MEVTKKKANTYRSSVQWCKGVQREEEVQVMKMRMVKVMRMMRMMMSGRDYLLTNFLG